jgi:glycosyltransferase involved in cell wall biosynthesis
MNIAVITPRYTIAGVPLAQARFARALANKGFNVEFIIGYVEPGNKLPEIEGASVIHLKKLNVRGMFFSIFKLFLKKKYDVVFAAEDHLTAIVLLASILSFSKSKISGSSRVTPYDTYSSNPLKKGLYLKILMRIVMWRANVLSCVSEDMVLQYKKIFRNSPHICIYNIVDDKLSRQKMKEPLDDEWFSDSSIPRIVAAGRLASWKDFPTLINAIAECKKSIDLKLIILGDGPLRSQLQDQIDRLKLSKNILLKGYVSNPLKYYCAADIFVLSSIVEGMPNVLVESMMCGCIPVSTDCPTGPRELLKDGEYGGLVSVGDSLDMAKKILECINLKKISNSQLTNAIKPFEENAVISRHFEMLKISI